MKPERALLIVTVLAAVIFVVTEELSGSDTCLMENCNITSDPSTWPSGDNVWNVARAIAFAEGANVPGHVPDSYNNPGDLTKGDEWGQSVNGYGENNIIEFSSKSAGWQALRLKLLNILDGGSSVYCSDWTIEQIAAKWTATQPQDWASNVASELQISTCDTLEGYVNG